VIDQTVSRDSIVFHAVGNVGPRRVEYREPIESLFGMAYKRIKEADISLCNLEMLFTTGDSLQYRDHVTWDSKADPGNARAIALAGFDVISHASNRCFDYGPDALLESIDVLRGNGMQVIGAGKDIAEARKPAILERNGIRAGLLGYNCVLPDEYEAREGKPGCAPIRVSTYFQSQGYQPGTPPKVITIARESDVADMEEDIRKLRGQVDVLALSVHWGLSAVPGGVLEYQPAIGRRAIEAGADLIFGSHGSTIRGVEVYKKGFIFYCLGTFAQDRAHSFKPAAIGTRTRDLPGSDSKADKEPESGRNPGARNRRYTMMARADVTRNGIRKVSFFPAWVNDRSEPEFLSRKDPRFQEVLDYVEPWCKSLGTRVVVEGDEVVVFDTSTKS